MTGHFLSANTPTPWETQTALSTVTSMPSGNMMQSQAGSSGIGAIKACLSTTRMDALFGPSEATSATHQTTQISASTASLHPTSPLTLHFESSRGAPNPYSPNTLETARCASPTAGRSPQQPTSPWSGPSPLTVRSRVGDANSSISRQEHQSRLIFRRHGLTSAANSISPSSSVFAPQPHGHRNPMSLRGNSSPSAARNSH